MRRLLLLPVAVLLLGVVAALQPHAADAHPLGNFTVSRYARVDLTPGLARLRYVVDMAEIPTFQERTAIDSDRDGSISDAEATAYATRLADSLLHDLSLTINDDTITFRLAEQALAFPPGQGGLDTLRLEYWFEGALPNLTGSVDARFRDSTFADRLGWKEIAVRAGPGIELSGATVPDTDTTNELRTYPDDLLQSPLDQREARFSIAPGAGRALTDTVATSTTERAGDRFASLITRELSLGVVLISLLIAMGLGAMHALGPGHGKTVVAAYLVGSRGTTRHAVFLGATVTITHTSSVFALGLVTLYLSNYILPEKLYPWLSLLSGLAVAALGLGLLASRLRGLRRPSRRAATLATTEAARTPAHAHVHPGAPASFHPRFRRHTHEHGGDHTHDHPHSHNQPRTGGLTHDGGHAHDSALHSHGGGRAHSHLPPGADGAAVTWRSLLALGVSGGILPCPSALVVLLTAISLHRVAYGMLLILSFSIGLAAVLTGIGLLLVHARGLFSRLPVDSAVARFAPVLSAGVVTALGTAIALRAATTGGGLL